MGACPRLPCLRLQTVSFFSPFNLLRFFCFVFDVVSFLCCCCWWHCYFLDYKFSSCFSCFRFSFPWCCPFKDWSIGWGAFPVPTFLWFLFALGPVAVGYGLVFSVPSYSHLSTPHQGPRRTLSLILLLLLLFDWAVVSLFAEAWLCHGIHGITSPG